MISSPNTDDTMDARVEAEIEMRVYALWAKLRNRGLLSKEAADTSGAGMSGTAAELIRNALLIASDAVAQAPQQPVAWRYRDKENDGLDEWQVVSFEPTKHDWNEVVPLYASPPREEDVQRLVAAARREALEEAAKAVREWHDSPLNDAPERQVAASIHRVIERLKDKP